MNLSQPLLSEGNELGIVALLVRPAGGAVRAHQPTETIRHNKYTQLPAYFTEK